MAPSLRLCGRTPIRGGCKLRHDLVKLPGFSEVWCHPVASSAVPAKHRQAIYRQAIGHFIGDTRAKLRFAKTTPSTRVGTANEGVCPRGLNEGLHV